MENKQAFWQWPGESMPSFWTVFLSLLLLASAYVGFGQLPLTYALHQEFGSSLGYLSISQMATGLGKNYFLTLILLPFVFSLAALLFAIHRIHKVRISRFFNQANAFSLDFKRLGISALLTLVIMGAGLFIEWNGGDSLTWNSPGFSFGMLVLISLLIIPLQTTCEELIFRSYLFKLFSTVTRPLVSIVITGVLFGCMHLSNPEIEVLGQEIVIFYIWSGIFMGIMTHLDDRLELAMGYHAANNIFASMFVTNSWQAFQTDALFVDSSPPEIGFELYLTLFLWQPIILVIFGRTYGWNWRRLWTES